MKFLVTGASGLLGINFCGAIAEDHHVLGIYQSNAIYPINFRAIQADLTNFDELKEIIEDFQPDVIVHCAAIANLETCRLAPEKAQLINAILPGEIAKITANTNCKLVAISTDAVFDGKTGDYTEDDLPNPLSVYAKTKLAGEKLVVENDPSAIIARVNFYGWSISGKRSLSEFFVNNFEEKNAINGFSDVNFSPLYVKHLVDILLEMIEKDLSGIFHVVSSENTTKFDFGVRIAKQFGFDKSLITPISVSDGNLSAPRSNNLNLNVNKLSSVLDNPTPTIDSGIATFFNDYQNRNAFQNLSHPNPALGGNDGN